MNNSNSILNRQIWHTPDKKDYYLIPEDFEFGSGEVYLVGMEGETVSTNADAIHSFQMNPHLIQEFLQVSLKQFIQQAKGAFLLLAQFTQHREGKRADTTYYDALFDQLITSGLGSALPPLFTETLRDKTQTPEVKESMPDEIRKYLTETETSDVFKAAIEQLQKMGVNLDKVMAENPDDPEQWFKDLNEKFFGKMNAAKKADQHARRQNEINDAIAEGLRQQGITPSKDMNKE